MASARQLKALAKARRVRRKKAREKSKPRRRAAHRRHGRGHAHHAHWMNRTILQTTPLLRELTSWIF